MDDTQIQHIVFGQVWGKKKRRRSCKIIYSVLAGKYLITKFPVRVSGNRSPALDLLAYFHGINTPTITDFKSPMWSH